MKQWIKGNSINFKKNEMNPTQALTLVGKLFQHTFPDLQFNSQIHGTNVNPEKKWVLILENKFESDLGILNKKSVFFPYRLL